MGLLLPIVVEQKHHGQRQSVCVVQVGEEVEWRENGHRYRLMGGIRVAPRAGQDAAPDLVEQEDVDPGTGQAKHPQARYRAQVQRIQDEGNQVQARKRRYFGIPLKDGCIWSSDHMYM